MELGNVREDLLMGDETVATVPAAVVASAPVLDMGFHPQLPILAAGLITGEVEIYERKNVEDMVKIPLQNDFSSWIFKNNYNEDEVVMNYHHQNMLMHPAGGVSSMEFTDDGAYLVTASSDRSISVMDCVSLRLVIHIPPDEVRRGTAGKKKLNAMNKKNVSSPAIRKKAEKGNGLTTLRRGTAEPVNPHRYGISSLNVCDDNMIATGDDDGLIAIWDMRERKPVHVYHEHGDYVSQLCYFTDAQELVSSSGDTCLGAYDVRAGKIKDFSVRRKDELNCFAFINSTGVSNATFIPSIVCGTPHGGIPIWKYGSWARPYDVMDRHPSECEAIVSFHSENTAFNHNLILTGACDGLVRVLQMYPVRRNLCQLSARDFTYSHSSVIGHQSSSGGSQQQGNYVARRTRGQEGISRMRVSHDANLLAVSGSDSIIDFVDIAFMNDEAELDRLRGRAEQRHLRTLRDLDRERDEEDERERRLIEGRGADSDSTVGSRTGQSPDSCDSSSPGSSSDSDDDETPAEKTARKEHCEALRLKFAKLGIAPKRHHGDTSSSSSSDEDAQKVTRKKQKQLPQSSAATTAKMKKSNGSDPTTKASKEAKDMKRQKSSASAPPKTAEKSKPKADVAKGEKFMDSCSTLREDALAKTEEVVDSMEVYRTERQKNRERAAAARWLKEERRKKINFTYEKRRRRVGGFFGDMVDRADDNE